MIPPTSARRAVFLLAFLATGAVALAQSPQGPQFADLSISGIFLDDPESVARVIGTPPPPVEIGDDFPTLQVCNSARTELLVLVFLYGGTKDAYSQIRVSEMPKPSPPCVVPPAGVTHFVTGKGVRLGMSTADLIRALGQGYSQSRQGNDTVLSYRLSGIDRSPLLQRFNMPVYAGSYRFRRGKLVAFEFGFPYP